MQYLADSVDGNQILINPEFIDYRFLPRSDIRNTGCAVVRRLSVRLSITHPYCDIDINRCREIRKINREQQQEVSCTV